MARGGIDKSLVKQAQQALLARGENPSIDAVRVELGNTGSKTTIHRYLKELEAEAAVKFTSDVLLGETVREMIATLAAQLHKDAQEIVTKAQNAHDDQVQQLCNEITERDQQLDQTSQQIEAVTEALKTEAQEHIETAQALTRAGERERDLELSNKEQAVGLKEKASQITSLEEKHSHAREGLDHYRQSVKEQREQEGRRHEHQVQHLQVEQRSLNQKLVVKQEELTVFLSQATRLTAELKEARHASMQHELIATGHADTISAQIEELGRLKGAADEHEKLRKEYAALKQSLQTALATLQSQEIDLTRLKAEANTADRILSTLGLTTQPEDKRYKAERGEIPKGNSK